MEVGENDNKCNVQDKSHMGNRKKEGDKSVMSENTLGESNRRDNGELQ